MILIEDLKSISTHSSKPSNEPSSGDFPDVVRMQKQLAERDFGTFPKANNSMLRAVDDMMRTDITNLMRKIPEEVNVRDLKAVEKSGT